MLDDQSGTTIASPCVCNLHMLPAWQPSQSAFFRQSKRICCQHRLLEAVALPSSTHRSPGELSIRAASQADSLMHVLSNQADQNTEVLKAELDRTKNAHEHLEQSNVDLQEAIRAGGPDADFQQAIEVTAGTSAVSGSCLQPSKAGVNRRFCQAQENIVVLARQQGKIAKLQQEIQETESLHQHQQPEPTWKAAHKQQLGLTPAAHNGRMPLRSHLHGHVHSLQPAVPDEETQVPGAVHDASQRTSTKQQHQPGSDILMADSHVDSRKASDQDRMWL